MSEHAKTTIPVAYQLQFVEAFLRQDLPQHHLLVAPPGTGKTHTACTIVERLSTMGQANHVLVLAPAMALRAQWAGILSALGDVPAIALDRQVFRELQASVPVGQAPWSRAPRVVIGIELLRHADVYEAIVSQVWDLVIVDECHRLRVIADPRLRTKVDGTLILRQLVEQQHARRLLLMTATPGERARYLPNIQVTEWEVPLPPYRAVNVAYEPQRDEQEFLDALSRFLEAELVGPASRVIRHSLLRQAESSIFCLAPQLQYWIDKIERADKGVPEAEQSLEEESESGVDTEQPWRDPAAAVAGLRSLLQRLDAVRTDGKLDALRLVVGHDMATDSVQVSHVCVVTAMNRTASYLHSALQSVRIAAFRLGGEFDTAYVRETIERFQRQGGVLVAVPSGLRGFELPEVQAVVVYDPLSETMMEQVLGRFNRIGRTSPLHVIKMSRSSGVRAPASRD